MEIYKFRIRKKLFSLSNQYLIYDDQDNMQFRAKGSLFTIRKRLKVYDLEDQVIAEIISEFNLFKPKYRIILSDNEYRLVSSWNLRERIIADSQWGGDAFIIQSNLLHTEFTFRRAEDEFAFLSKRIFQLEREYGLAVKSSENLALVLSSVLVLDLVKTQKKQSGA